MRVDLFLISVALVAVLAGPSSALAASKMPSAMPPLVIISDVDDTIRVGESSVTGMAKLYSSLVDEASRGSWPTSFYVLSETPQLFESSLLGFLETEKFPEPSRVLARPLLLTTEQYKTQAVSMILADASNAAATVLLIGDDTGSDFSAYVKALNGLSAISAQPARTSLIYLRRVSGAAPKLVQLTSNALVFDSAADIAISEFAQGRLSRSAVETVMTEVENEKDQRRLFVNESTCPSARDGRASDRLSLISVPEDLLARYQRLEERLRVRCASRPK